LRGTRCRPATADIAVRTRAWTIRRPDITITRAVIALPDIGCTLPMADV
jgi:hypothetical protein